jgi:hypothetical protein
VADAKHSTSAVWDSELAKNEPSAEIWSDGMESDERVGHTEPECACETQTTELNPRRDGIKLFPEAERKSADGRRSSQIWAWIVAHKTHNVRMINSPTEQTKIAKGTKRAGGRILRAMVEHEQNRGRTY